MLEPLGPNTLLTVRVGEQTIRVAAEPDVGARHGDIIHLQPRADRIRWFDAQSQKAIAA